MKTKRSSNRPTWAKKMPIKLWRDLCKCQNTSKPTLKQLVADTRMQESHGLVCWTCKSALQWVHENQH